MAGLFLVQTRDRDFADSALAAARAAIRAARLPGAERGGVSRLAAAPRAAYLRRAGKPARRRRRSGRGRGHADLRRQDGPAGARSLARLDRAAGAGLEPDRRPFRRFGPPRRPHLPLHRLFRCLPAVPRRECALFSTSLLAAAAALPRLSFDAQGVYEFAFNVVPVGDDTVFAELKTLGPGPGRRADRRRGRLPQCGEAAAGAADARAARRADRAPIAKGSPQIVAASCRGISATRYAVRFPAGSIPGWLLAALRAAGLPAAASMSMAGRAAATSRSPRRSPQPRGSRSNGSTRSAWRDARAGRLSRAGRAQFPDL